MELRARGWTYQQIADEIGYAAPSSACDAVNAALRRMQKPAAIELRQMMDARMESAHAEACDVLNEATDPPRPSDDADGEAWQAYYIYLAKAKELRLKCIDRLISTEQRRAKLWGADMPTKIAPTTPEGKTLEQNAIAARGRLASLLAQFSDTLTEGGGLGGPNGSGDVGGHSGGDDEPA